MRPTHRLLLPLLVLLPCALAAAPAHDYERVEHHTYHIEPQGTGFSLRSSSDIRHTFLSERSTATTTFALVERYYDRISDLDGGLGGWRFTLGDLTSHVNPAGDAFLSDATVRPITLSKRAKVGDVLHYTCEREYAGLEYLPIITVPSINYLHEYTITFQHPSDVKVSFEFFFPHGAVPYTLENTDPEETTLRFTDLEQRSEIPGYGFNGSHASVLVVLTRNGTTVSCTTPAAVAGWYFSQCAHRPVLGPRFDTLLSTQLNRAATPAAKLRVIGDYVRSTVRYIADEADINAFIPRHPDTVLARGYGDCKDRAYLVATLAARYNIPVSMALVSTAQEPPFASTHFQLYNHMICAWRQGERWVFTDPTAKYCEFGNLPASDTETRALVLDPSNPTLVMIPPTGADTSIKIDLRATLGALKQGSARIVLRNGYKQQAEAALERLTGIERENFLSNMITAEFQKLSFDNITVDSVTNDAVFCSAVADLSLFVIASPTRHYIPQLPFALPPNSLLDRANDTFQLALGEPTSVALRIELDAGGGTIQPLEASFGSDVGAFSASARQSGSIVQCNYRLRAPRRFLADAEKQTFLSFCQKLFAAKREMFIIARQ